MKKTISFVIILMTFSLSANDAASLKSTLKSFLTGASINDSVIHNNFWAEELVYTSSNGTRFNKKKLMTDVKAGTKIKLEQATIRYSAESVSIKMLKDIAVLNFILIARNPETNKVDQRYLNSGVMVWRDKRWQAMNWHATKMPANKTHENRRR